MSPHPTLAAVLVVAILSLSAHAHADDVITLEDCGVTEDPKALATRGALESEQLDCLATVNDAATSLHARRARVLQYGLLRDKEAYERADELYARHPDCKQPLSLATVAHRIGLAGDWRGALDLSRRAIEHAPDDWRPDVVTEAWWTRTFAAQRGWRATGDEALRLEGIEAGRTALERMGDSNVEVQRTIGEFCTDLGAGARCEAP